MKKTKKEKIYKYTVIFEPAEEGGYIVKVPALDGLTTQGETLAEARFMAKDAIKGYIESLRKDNLPIPREKENGQFKIEKLEVNLEYA